MCKSSRYDGKSSSAKFQFIVGPMTLAIPCQLNAIHVQTKGRDIVYSTLIEMHFAILPLCQRTQCLNHSAAHVCNAINNYSISDNLRICTNFRQYIRRTRCVDQCDYIQNCRYNYTDTKCSVQFTLLYSLFAQCFNGKNN